MTTSNVMTPIAVGRIHSSVTATSQMTITPKSTSRAGTMSHRFGL